MKMETLIAAVGASVQRAQSAVEQAAVEQYLGYFHRRPTANDMLGAEGPEQALRPRTLEVQLPDGEGEERRVAVPLVALANHNTLRLEQVKVRLNITPSLTEEETVEVEAAPNSENGHSVELVFQSDGATEAAARISDAANRLL